MATSGETGIKSVALSWLEMISKLSNVYQIFAISHQPHLSSKADQHFVVTKKADQSVVKRLDDEGRVEEIARIIAGENPTLQAVEFAKKLRSK
jgi:DNA repair protein RecN (Recombination protein N)